MAKILIAEDEENLRELLVEHLEGVGYSVIQACDGREALNLFARDQPDLVLSDISMPVMDGYELLHAIRKQHPDKVQVPFIYLSALSDRDNELKGLRLGVDEYIGKPVDFDILAARIEKCLRSASSVVDSHDQQDDDIVIEDDGVIEGLGDDGLVKDFATSFSSIIDQYLPRK